MPRSVAIAVQGLALIGAVVGLHYLAIVPYRGNLELRAVADSSTAAQTAEPQRAAMLASDNLVRLDRAAAMRHFEPTWYMLYGINCEVLDRFPDAIDAYTRALQVDDRPEIYVNRAMVLLHLGRTDAALADLSRAARFNPFVVEQLDGDLRARVTAAAGLP